jgi:hypothetical protein
MQPILQLGLDKAGELLGENFGSGLLQVWVRVGRNADELNVIELGYSTEFDKAMFFRILPWRSVEDEPSSFYPEFAPWRRGDPAQDPSKYKEAELFFRPLSPAVQAPLITWKSATKMVERIDFEDHGFRKNAPIAFQTEQATDWMTLHDRFELFEELIEGSLTVAGREESIFLGGVAGGAGPHDPTLGYLPIVSIRDSEQMHITVVYDQAKWIAPATITQGGTKKIEFDRTLAINVVFSYRSYN